MGTAKEAGVTVREATFGSCELLSEFIDGAAAVSAALEVGPDGHIDTHVAMMGCDCKGCRAAMIAALRSFADDLERGPGLQGVSPVHLH